MATESPSPALSIVIPAFNEVQNVAEVVREVVAVLAESAAVPSYELILVDDGSADGTVEEMARLQSAYANVKVVVHERNRGFGAALKSGYRASSGTFVTLLTSDGEFDPREVLQLYALAGDADLVLSHRERHEDVASVVRTVLSSGFRRLNALVLGFDPADLMGIYVIRGEVLRRLELRSDTGLMNNELQMRCFALGCRVRYGVMHTRPRLSGESKVTNMRTIATVLFEMLKLRFSR